VPFSSGFVCFPWLRGCKEINFTVPEEKNGSDLEDFSAAGVPVTPARKNRREMNRFFPREL
jgi:hypothetical protein